jgi:hypothetical protein
LKIRKSQVRFFNTTFESSFSNNSYKISTSRYGNPTLLELFAIQNVKVDSVYIKFNISKELELSYNDSGILCKKTFNGQFTKKGYYEFFFSNKKKQVPPFIPFFYSKYDINRLRIALTTQGDLIIDNQWNQSGSIFIIGAGDKGRRQSIFKTHVTN